MAKKCQRGDMGNHAGMCWQHLLQGHQAPGCCSWGQECWHLLQSRGADSILVLAWAAPCTVLLVPPSVLQFDSRIHELP